MEFYEDVKIKRLEWGEDLYYLSNPYCPYCGNKFNFDDEVIEITAAPVVKVTGDEELDKLVITVHLKCLLKTLEGEDDE